MLVYYLEKTNGPEMSNSDLKTEVKLCLLKDVSFFQNAN